jgi:3-hydroxyacyl-[acyl-carrier-protein] dehydratase
VKFVLIDRVSEIEHGKRIVAHKSLSLAEEYLADHFPSFPVLPGVLMLEAMVQASAWLVHATTDFRHSLVLLKEARNVTYRSFVAPGQTLTIEASCKELGETYSRFIAKGRSDGRDMVKAALVLRHLSLEENAPELAETDRRIRQAMRKRFELVSRDMVVAAAAEG